MVKIPETQLFITIDLSHLRLGVRKDFAKEITRAARECTHHQLRSELTDKRILHLGPFPYHNLEFIQGALCGLAHGMKLSLSGDQIGIHVEPPKK